MVTEPPLEAEGPARDTVAAYARRWWTDVKGGELGSLPIIVGLIIIAIVFQTQNDRFLTASNFVNLIVQTAPYAVIAMGVTFALLLGEIDLSIGFVSGVGGVLIALLVAPDGNEMATLPAFILCLAAGLGIGLLHGLIITKVGVPSFVVTLAGLLAWNGVVLLLIGSRGTVILQNDFVVGLANDFMDPGLSWVLFAVCVGLYAAIHFLTMRSRAKAGLANDPLVIVLLRIGGLAVVLAIVIAVANQDRGVPYSGILVGGLFVFWTYILNRTSSGATSTRSAATPRPRAAPASTSTGSRSLCFMFCSLMAVLGGIILASRLRSVDTNTGGGQALLYPIAAAVIGGTSLFGGRGTMKAALLGALVMISIDNGLGLLGLSSGTKFVVTGGVLLLAVSLDSISRRGRAQSGRA